MVIIRISQTSELALDDNNKLWIRALDERGMFTGQQVLIGENNDAHHEHLIYAAQRMKVFA